MEETQGPRKVRLKVAPKLERIYRVLLDDPLRKWSVKGLSKEAMTEYHWTYDICKDLQDQGILSDGKVVDVGPMFELWTKRPSSSLFREYHIQDPGSWIRDQRNAHAITTYYAENKLGQYLLPKSLDVYVQSAEAYSWHERIMKVGYAGKGNLRLLVPDEHVFWHTRLIEGLRIVSIQQLIVDLFREGGVCAEAAENLIRRYYDEK